MKKCYGIMEGQMDRWKDGQNVKKENAGSQSHNTTSCCLPVYH